MSKLYPLRFQPILRRYLWGGRRLATRLGKRLGPESDFAESWEIVDHGTDQSTVQYGALAGRTLGELVRNHGPELLGRHHPQQRFPLLLKFLDAHKTLSVQVHPNDEQAGKQSPPDAGKTEAWIVLAAESGSLIYAGLRPGVDREALRRAIREGTCEEQLHRFEPAVGDCVFIPAGTVHALGAGLVVAEIQQSSDTTFRLFDWNRVDSSGNPRPLHVAEALEVVDFHRGPVEPQLPQATLPNGQERLVECDQFVLHRWRLNRPQEIGDHNQCHIVSVLEGAVTVRDDPADRPLTTGSTALLPAVTGAVEVAPLETAVLLVANLP